MGKSIQFLPLTGVYARNRLFCIIQPLIPDLALRGVYLSCAQDGEVLTDLAGRFALFLSPEVRLSPIAPAERLPFAVVKMPGGGSFRAGPFGNCINKLHKSLSFTRLYALILPKHNNAL
jgi:hypothetical protein